MLSRCEMPDGDKIKSCDRFHGHSPAATPLIRSRLSSRFDRNHHRKIRRCLTASYSSPKSKVLTVRALIQVSMFFFMNRPKSPKMHKRRKGWVEIQIKLLLLKMQKLVDRLNHIVASGFKFRSRGKDKNSLFCEISWKIISHLFTAILRMMERVRGCWLILCPVRSLAAFCPCFMLLIFFHNFIWYFLMKFVPNDAKSGERGCFHFLEKKKCFLMQLCALWGDCHLHWNHSRFRLSPLFLSCEKYFVIILNSLEVIG